MDNKKKIFILEIINFVFCLIFSSFNHFLFELTNNSMVVGWFVPINESVWEHGKLLFMPFLFFSIIEYFFLKENKNYCFAKCIPLIFSIPLMLMMYYTYTGIIGYHVLAVDIIISMLVIVIMCIVSYKILVSKKQYRCSWIYPTLVLAIFICCIVFTFYPPNIPLFISSI